MSYIIQGGIDIESLLKGKALLDRALPQAKSELEIAGAIQTFEINYELAWKTLKRILAYRGITVASPREAFRQAFKADLIKDAEKWFGFISMRNQTSHVYNEDIALDIFNNLPEFQTAMTELVDKLKSLKDE